MSELEQLTKPLLGPMVDGKSVELSGTQQVVLAGWMLKTLMVFDWLMGEQFWRQDERSMMFQRQLGQAVKDCMTYAGHYSGTYKAIAYPRRQTVRRLGGEDTGIPVFSGVLVVGKALMWLQKDRYKEMTGRDCVLWGPRHSDRLTQLGGPQSASINWPPPKTTFDDAAFEEFLRSEGVS